MKSTMSYSKVISHHFKSVEFTVGDLKSIVSPKNSLRNGARLSDRNDGIIIPSGQTGANAQIYYEIPLYNLLSGTVVKYTINLDTSTDVEFETPFAFTVVMRQCDGSTITTGFISTLTKLTSTTWMSTTEYTLVGNERTIEFIFTVDNTSSIRTSDASIVFNCASVEFLCTTASVTILEQLLGYRDNIQLNRSNKLTNDLFNQTSTDGTRDFISIVSAVNSLGSGESLISPNEALIYAGDYKGEVDASTDIDPGNFCNIISRTKEQDVIIDGRQPVATENQALIETLFLKHSSHIKGMTFLAENSRYPIHIENGNSNDRAVQTIEDVTAIHFGADEWASPTAIGIGQHDGAKLTLKRITAVSPTNAVGFHNNIDWIHGASILIEDSKLSTTNDDGSAISCSSIGSGVLSIFICRNTTLNGHVKINTHNWSSTLLVNQPANRYEYKMIFDNCSAFDWISKSEVESLILTSLAGDKSDIVLSGTAFVSLFGARAEITSGGVGLAATAISNHAVTVAGLETDPGVTLGARLGDLSIKSKTLNIFFDGETSVNIVLNKDYSSMNNATVIKSLNITLVTAEGISTGRVFTTGKPYENRAPIYQPTREGFAKNNDTTAILKGDAIAWDGRHVKIMTNAEPVNRFAGIALENAVVGEVTRFQLSGYINEVHLNLTGTPIIYQMLEVGLTAGQLQVGTTKPILSLRSEQSFGDTYEFVR